MRALNKFAGRLLLVLFALLVTPLVAAAQAAEAVPHVGSPGVFTAVAVAGLGIGAVVTLRTKDATGNKKTILLDTDKPEQVAESIDQYAELKAAEQVEPLKAQLTASETESKALKDVIVGEILRVKKLTAPKNEKGEVDFDLDGEKAYLEGLPAARLKMEFDRLPARETVKNEAVTTADKPADPDNVYAALEA